MNALPRPSSPQESSDRRHHRRHGAQLAADVLRRQGDEALGWVTDISVGGAQLHCRGPLEEGETVTLLLHPDDERGKRRVVFGKVVRVRPRRPGSRDLWTHAAAIHFLWPLAANDSGLEALAQLR